MKDVIWDRLFFFSCDYNEAEKNSDKNENRSNISTNISPVQSSDSNTSAAENSTICIRNSMQCKNQHSPLTSITFGILNYSANDCTEHENDSNSASFNLNRNQTYTNNDENEESLENPLHQVEHVVINNTYGPDDSSSISDFNTEIQNPIETKIEPLNLFSLNRTDTAVLNDVLAVDFDDDSDRSGEESDYEIEFHVVEKGFPQPLKVTEDQLVKREGDQDLLWRFTV